MKNKGEYDRQLSSDDNEQKMIENEDGFAKKNKDTGKLKENMMGS